ncbi:MAG: serine acetyltransferase [Succinivibrionaceae bacterium]|nr:serine acetyltransferase [Succinivibrionaceae bacterium]
MITEEQRNEINSDLRKLTSDLIIDYSNERAIDNMDNIFHQPDREVIFECIRNLMKVLFPGYYRTCSYKVYNVKSMIGPLIEDIHFHLSRQIAIAMNNTADPEHHESDSCSCMEKAIGITTRFMQTIPSVRAKLEEDLAATYQGDPAAGSLGEIIVAYPGFFAISIHRLAHELSLLDVPLIPRVMSEYAHSRTGIDIHPGATIGHYFFIDHGTGIVIGQSTVIGDHVKIYQGVTLGALSTQGGQSLKNKRRHPTIEDNVTIYSNASILGGDTVIGHDSVIGGNAFVTKSVKPGSRVSVKTEELVISQRRGGSDDENWYYVI